MRGDDPGIDVNLVGTEVIERFQHQAEWLRHKLVRGPSNFLGEDIHGQHRHGAADHDHVRSQRANLGRQKLMLKFQFVHDIAHHAGKQFPPHQGEEFVVIFPKLHGLSEQLFSPSESNLLHKLFRRVGDQLQIAFLRACGQAAAHADRDGSGLDPLCNVVDAYAAGRHQGCLGQRTFHCLHECWPQSFTGEEFHDVGATLHRVHDLAHGPRARHVRNLITVAQPRGFNAHRWADNVLGAGQNGDARGLRIENRSRADEDFSRLVFFGEVLRSRRPRPEP